MRDLLSHRSAVLAYHGIAPRNLATDPGFLRIAPDTFRRQVELLLEARFEFLSVASFASRLSAAGPPPGLIALSFDDGWDDNHEYLLPLLEEYRLPATVYVTTGLVGKPNPWMPGARMMNEAELRDLARAGLDFGAHTVSHPDMSALGYETCLAEMTESRDELQRICGRPVRTFAYPFCFYGEPAVRAARDAGFDAAVTCGGRGSWEALELKRASINSKDGVTSFVLKLLDVYQPLFESSAGRLLRTSTRSARARLRSRLDT